MVGLDPRLQGDDIPKFEMSYARLPQSVFFEIFDDFEDLSCQYGHLSMHDDVRNRSRFLSAYFNRIVALFSGRLLNTLEGTRDRVMCQFKTYDGVTVVLIEVKLEAGSLSERLSYYAQVIAECNGELRMTLIKTLG
jgi:hypothetical protein